MKYLKNDSLREIFHEIRIPDKLVSAREFYQFLMFDKRES